MEGQLDEVEYVRLYKPSKELYNKGILTPCILSPHIFEDVGSILLYEFFSDYSKLVEDKYLTYRGDNWYIPFRYGTIGAIATRKSGRTYLHHRDYIPHMRKEEVVQYDLARFITFQFPFAVHGVRHYIRKAKQTKDPATVTGEVSGKLNSGRSELVKLIVYEDDIFQERSLKIFDMPVSTDTKNILINL